MYPFAVAAGMAALYFLAAAFQRPRPAGILAAILWAAYAVYEYHVANGTLCDPYCNIRVDLVLFIPVLVGTTWLALLKAPRAGAVAVWYVICLGLAAALAAVFGYTVVAAIAGACTLAAAVYGVRAAFAGKRT